MTEVAIYQSEKVSVEIYHALETPFAKDMNDADLFDFLKGEIGKAFAVSGYTCPAGREGELFINEVIRDIRQICKSFALRRDEISIAFSRGVRKEYGDFVGLPIVRFFEFLKSYCANNDRMRALAERHKQEPKTEPTEQEKFDIEKRLALKAFNDLKDGKDISLIARSVYDFLDRLKLIEFSAGEKKAFFEQARIDVIADQQIRLSGTTRTEAANKIKQTIEGLQTGCEQELVKARAKYLALLNFFQGLLLEEQELSI